MLVVTSDDIDKIVETDSSVSLISLLIRALQISVLVSGDDTPLFIKDIIKIYSTLSVHSNYIISNTLFLSNKSNITYKASSFLIDLG
jgi:hypothetical protein